MYRSAFVFVVRLAALGRSSEILEMSEIRMDSLEKEREMREIQYDIFSGSLSGLSETEELPVDFNEKLFHRLVDYATVYSDSRVVSLSETAWKSERRFKAESGRGIGFVPDASGRFFCA